MSSNGAAHLTEEQMAGVRDGELSPAAVAHLQHCPECGRRLRDLNAAVAAYAEYRDSIRAPLLPRPPKPWRGLGQLIAEREDSGPLRWLWGPAMAAAFVLALALALQVAHRPLEQSSARANELLVRSSRVELPRQRLIALKAHGRTLVRPAVLNTETANADDPELAHLQMIFAAAHYSWREPLSPRSFQAWRNGLKDKRDSVSTIRQAGEKQFYRVRTDTPAGVLRSASLTLRAEDLRATAGDFEFQGEGPVAMEEAVPEAAPQAPAKKEPEAGEAPATNEAPAANKAPVETPAGPDDTLHVLAALDEIGAGAGEPIEVADDPLRRHVVVRAGGLSQQRQQQVAKALQALPRVTVDFETAARNPSPSQSSVPQTFSSSIPAALRQRFEALLGGPVAVQTATDRALDASASALAWVHAMEVLAEKFPPGTEAQLIETDRLLLRQLRQRHMTDLQASVARIRTALKPLLTPTGPMHQAAMENGGEQTWQAGIPALGARARETDQLLNRLLAGSYSETAGEEMLNGLGPALERLEWSIQVQTQQSQAPHSQTRRE